jgi:hypothetical protein
VVGRVLLGVGLVVGIAAGVGLLVGFEPSRLPPALLNIAAYKLTALAAAGLLAAGAIVLRYARREAEGSAHRATRTEPRALGDGPADEIPVGRTRAAEDTRVNRRTDKSPR